MAGGAGSGRGGGGGGRVAGLSPPAQRADLAVVALLVASLSLALVQASAAVTSRTNN
jgi:hypothetical protein